MATLLKKLTLRLGDDQFECQLTRAEVTDEPTTTEFQSFCGTEQFASSNFRLNLEGAQDWTDVDGICNIIDAAFAADPVQEIDFEVALGEPAAAWRSGQCKPTNAPSFGGSAGDPLQFTQVLDIVGTPDKVALT